MQKCYRNLPQPGLRSSPSQGMQNSRSTRQISIRTQCLSFSIFIDNIWKALNHNHRASSIAKMKRAGQQQKETMKQLIINSDDYGRTPEISRGIREAHSQGVVTSTTCMMNIPTTAADIAVALKETPSLGLGVHLVLTMGNPISSPDTVLSLTDANGH